MSNWKILRQAHIKAVAIYDKWPKTEERRESRGYHRRPTSKAPRRVPGEPSLEQTHPYNEIEDPIGRQYRASKIAEQEYRKAGAKY
ncbi:hypothetical protein GJ744_010821 [Endocarpon pusillum]|uniref:Uncharacterized protein n=1 Tax=Endocarpon pusillum TaxID=364733 RepID=A0A8H7AE55_9EURO|nr:hypothetical protein GJ744_010821 [Endocarpon pusillum]